MKSLRYPFTFPLFRAVYPIESGSREDCRIGVWGSEAFVGFLRVETPEPAGGNRRSGDGFRGDCGQRQVRPGGGDEAAGVGPGLDVPLAAGGDDAEAGGVEPAAFVGSGAEADAAGDDGVAQRALGLVVGRRQPRVEDEGDDRIPIVEDFAGELANLLLDLVPVAPAVPLDAAHQPLDGRRVAALAIVDPLDQAAQVAHQVATGACAIPALREREALADQMRQAALAARTIAVGGVAVGDQPAEERIADQSGQFLLAAAGDAEDGRHRRRRHPHPAQDALLIPGGLVDMDDIGRAHLLNELLDDGLACQAEFVDAALDGRHAELQAQPVAQKFLDLAAREAQAERQRRDEGREHRTNQTALAHLQVPPAPLDIRARSDAGAGEALVTARAAHGEVDVLGRRDLKSHFAADEFEAVVRADASALQVRPQSGLAGGARRRRGRDFRADDDRLAAPEPFRAGLFAGRFGGFLLASFARVLGRGGGRRCAAVPVGGRWLSSLAAPIRIIARGRARTGRRVLARAVGQRTRQLTPPPRQLFEFLARHRREVCPLDIVQVRGESGRHARRRIAFAPNRKPSARRSHGNRLPSLKWCKGGCERLRARSCSTYDLASLYTDAA